MEETEQDLLLRLKGILRQLRSPEGCLWDRQQDTADIGRYLLEEAYEVIEAIDAGDSGSLQEELGDLLFQILFIARIAEEKGDFTLAHVMSGVADKMIRRHPHVFGDVAVRSARDVKDNWEKIKAGEKAASGKKPDAVPESLPALMRAYRVLSRLAHADDGGEGRKWDDARAAAGEFARKSRNLEAKILAGSAVAPETVGELLIEVVNLARMNGLRPEDCLHERLNSLDPAR